MSSSGYSGTPLARKLGIRAHDLVGALGAPQRLPGLLDPLPEGVRLVPDPPPGGGPEARFDVLLLFVRSREELTERLPPAKRLLDPHGGLWVAWPKQSSPLASDLRKGGIREEGLSAGLVDNKVCAVDEDWSGLRFVYRVEDRPGR